MGVEFMLVDHERREYFDLGKNFGFEAFESGKAGKMLDSNGERCYGNSIRRPASAAELAQWLREEMNDLPWWKDHLDELTEIAKQIFAFLAERPNVACMHNDSSWDQENYVEVGTRYRESDSTCEGCRTGAGKVDNEEHDPLTHEHFRVPKTTMTTVKVHDVAGTIPVGWTCLDCGKPYNEHPFADEYKVDDWAYDDEDQDPAFGPFLRRLCNRELVKVDILPEPRPPKPVELPPPGTPRMRMSQIGFGAAEILPGETVEVKHTIKMAAFRANRFISTPEEAEVLSVEIRNAGGATFEHGPGAALKYNVAMSSVAIGQTIVLTVRNPTDKPIKWAGAFMGAEHYLTGES